MASHKLGDTVEAALKKVGITEERVSKWLGRPCACRARREKLNRLGQWALNTLGLGRDEQESRAELGEVTGGEVVEAETQGTSTSENTSV